MFNFNAHESIFLFLLAPFYWNSLWENDIRLFLFAERWKKEHKIKQKGTFMDKMDIMIKVFN